MLHLTRIKIVSGFIMLFAVFLIAKLFLLQIIHRANYVAQADHQYATPSSNVFDRGSIYFLTKDGERVSAATLISGFKLAITPSEILDKEALYNTLNSFFPIKDHDQFIAKASKVGDPYEEIVNHLTKETADAISALKIKGVYIYKEKWRFYPGQNMASKIVGLVGYSKDILAGRYGLERFYDSTLSRTIDNPYLNFFAEVFTDLKKTLSSSVEGEGDIVTTIEPNVQNFVESELGSALTKVTGSSAGAIVMDPKTGEIIAMTGLPDFNPNDFSKETDPLVFSNPLVENVYEFGSVIKPIVMASALDAGVVTPETTYFDKGVVIVGNKTIRNFDKKGRGVATMQDVLNQSLNTGMVFVAQKLGNTLEQKYMLSYGIGEKTGIDLPNETKGLVSNLTHNRDVEMATAAFGQGIALTPIEAVRAFSALANGGKLITPHLVKEIDYKDGGSKKIETDLSKVPMAILSPTASETISRMLVTVVDEGYKAYNVSNPHYSVAAKTGTAQIADEKNGGYYADRHTHSLFGYFPAYDPKFLIFMFIRDPHGVQYSIESLHDPFFNTVKFLINYYNIPPDR